MFGYKAGSFTGADKDKPGRFALADGGTLLLDEIGEVSPAFQVKLLRVLQERAYEPLGATKTEKVDVRVIVATNRDLSEQMLQGSFREDLYYRINVVRLELPPLRRRKEDIPDLVREFIHRFNTIYERSVSGITLEALSLLIGYDWPGNIRELENAIERSFILCQEGQITVAHLPEDLTSRRGAAHTPRIKAARDSLEAQTIRSALERNGFNRLATARELGIHKSTLFRKIRKLGLELPSRDGRFSKSSK
jgi:transcriptional regulator with PAS, ATPase and Fis domain